jgi:NSS family neurotransmitter:Na+ symporter
VVAILLAVFAGWCLTRHLSGKILGHTPQLFAAIWFWVMRLVLPVVVAYIGIQYTVFSLNNLCESDSKAIWCSQPAMELSGSDEKPDVPERGHRVAPAKPEPATKADDTLDVNKRQEKVDEVPEREPPAPESAPQNDDILYHSV